MARLEALPVVSLDVGRADIPSGAVGTAWRAQLLRDRGPPGTSRSSMTGRVSSSEDAARVLLLVLLVAPGLAGAFTPMRLSHAAPGYLNPGTLEGPRTNHRPVGLIPCTQETREV